MLQSFLGLFEAPRQDATTRIEILKGKGAELNGLAAMTYHERISEFGRKSTRHWVNEDYCNTIIDFRPLYAITIHHLQRQLVEGIRVLEDEDLTDQQLGNTRKLLKQYSNQNPSRKNKTEQS